MTWDSGAGDARFFQRTGPHSLAAVVDAAGGEAPPRRLMFRGVAPLAAAEPEDVSFLDNRKYLGALQRTRAGAVLVHPGIVDRVPATAVAIQCTDVYAAWARVATLFFPPPPAVPGIHPSAVIGEGVQVDPSAEIGPLVVIGEGAVIGRRTRVGPLSTIGPGVEIGADCRIGPNTSVSHARLGDRVCLFPGVRVGQEGFGFAVTDRGFMTVPQLGRVVIHDDVEIGANTTVDRGGMSDTVIGAGTRIDNLVQIAHGVRLGRCCVLVAQCGISGSTVVEDFVQIGGQAGITGHLTIGRGAKLTSKAGIMQDVPAGAEMGGYPGQPRRAWMREVAWLRRVTRAQGWGLGGAPDTKKPVDNKTD